MARPPGAPSDPRRGSVRRRGRKPSLTLELIAGAALEVADAEGLEAVTIKRLGEALGVGAMTLYGYVRTKEEILEAMTEIAVAELELPVAGPWQEQLFSFFSQMHAMLVRHPAVALLNARQPLGVGPATLAAIERALELTLEGGMTGRDAVRAFRSLMSHTLGSSLFYVARQGDLAGTALQQRASTIHAAKPSEFPVIVALADHLAEEATADHFERGLAHLIAGIEAEAGGGDAGGTRAAFVTRLAESAHLRLDDAADSAS